MNRIIEIVAMCLGGFSLLAVSFLGFAVISGQPLHELAVVGSVFPMPAEKSDADVVAEAEKAARPKTEFEVIQRNKGMLAAWELPSPFNATELETLAARLKNGRAEVESKTQLLDEREAELDQREAQIGEQMENLLGIRKSLDDFRRQLEERSSEVTRDESVATATKLKEAKATADIVAGMPLENAATALVSYYPEEASLILGQMDPKKAQKILGSMFEQDPKAWKTISADYARITASKS